MGAYLRRDRRAIASRDLDFVLTTFLRLAEQLSQDASNLSTLIEQHAMQTVVRLGQFLNAYDDESQPIHV